MELLRFFTAGNVDDGKSTLIGRLLYDSNSISTDIIETLSRQSKTVGVDSEIDLALLTDGLRAEREQGITIDVAYKYFSTDKRKFIIADTPGHAQYTRNMFTGASNTDLAIILIDARNGITEQTKRHSIISSILGIPHVLICINKMDLVEYKESVFEKIKSDYLLFSEKLGLSQISFIPVSALAGDNVVKPSLNLSWYQGESLFEFLENVTIQSKVEQKETRFQVQYVIRPQTEELHDYRGYAGSVLSGTINKGDQVQILPLDVTTTIEKIEKFEQEVQVAEEGDPIVIHLTDDLDVSRGSTIVKLDERPITDNVIEATICWMDNKSYQKGQKLLLQQNSFRSKVSIKEVEAQLDIHTFDHVSCEESMNLNDFYKVILKTAEPISYDPYSKNRKTGSFILINENSNNTVAAGIING
jgi:sulfate adenylyltransferase subunit 1